MRVKVRTTAAHLVTETTTLQDAVPVIRAAGVLPMWRQYVHSAETVAQAR